MTSTRNDGKQKDPAATPVMRQYLTAKEQNPDALLFFRLGDFYELFFNDAVVAAEALDLTLTSRNKNDPNPIPMCGVPHHAALSYIARLIDRGFKVAICEQMEDPTKVKGIVKREVVRVVTPGVVLEEENLDSKTNNFLAAVLTLQGADAAAVAVIDASTFEFKGTRVNGVGALLGELSRLEPRELLLPESQQETLAGLARVQSRCFVSAVADALFAPAEAEAALAAVLGPAEARALVTSDPLLAQAAAAVVAYVQTTRPQNPLPPTRFVAYEVADHLVLDEATKTHLELVRTASGDRKGSLFWLLDRTRTGMGGRLLRHWINYPLTDVAKIRRRLDRVELFFRDTRFRADVSDALARIGDIERLAGRIGLKAATPRDLGALRDALSAVPELDNLVDACPQPDAIEIIGGPLDRAEELGEVLWRALIDAPPVSAKDGGIFRAGFDGTLDDLANTSRTAKDFIADLEQRERARTGIASLKVAYNRVFGYYILITKANLKSVPPDYTRKQTVAGRERFVTRELEEWESKVLTADERRRELEAELFERLVLDLAPHVPRLLMLSRRIAELDAASALAEVARERDFVRPEVDGTRSIEIQEGRHPLVEALQPEQPFVPNDVRLDPERERMLIITGPNMAGKSTVMRQVALITVLAQLGSFVPARAARIGVSDRLYTRIGAADNIARGASTFMVEMRETASILRGATAASLVILDEVGRGTSTYDGLSIAWAVGEYLHDQVGCKVMFATHYHELVDLSKVKEHAVNYHLAAREYGDDIVFLRKLVEGGTSRSFGIQVARMAGLPETVVQRAREVLLGLESERPQKEGMPRSARHSRSAHPAQLDLFQKPQAASQVERVLRDINLDRVTPLEALALLSRLKGMMA